MSLSLSPVAELLACLGSGALIGFAVGYYTGRAARLRELHQLQKEGYLSIQVNARAHATPPTEDHPPVAHPSLREVLDSPDAADALEDFDGITERTYPRRDDPLRNGGWAQAIREKQRR